VFVAADREALVERLRRFAAGDAQAADAACRVGARPRRVAFVFPGQGGQWVGMARELLAQEPAFREALARCDAALPDDIDWSVIDQLGRDPDTAGYRLGEIGVLQPVLLAVEIALAELWRAWGVEPEAVVGHSMGEVGAAYFAGAFSLDHAMLLICARSALLQRTSGAGAMAVVELSVEQATRRIAPWGDAVCVAVSNGPRSTVVSGEPTAVAALLAELEREGVFCRAVKVDVASHSAQMDPLVPELVALLRELRALPTSIALYSAVHARRVDGGECDAQYWGRNLRQPVLFAQTVSAMLADGIDAVVEVSPHPALLTSLVQAGAGEPPLTLASLRRGEPERAAMLASLGALWAAGHPVAWQRLFEDRSYARVRLPHYPWQRERHWSEAALPISSEGGARHGRALDGEKRGWLYVPRWEPARLDDGARAAPARWLLVGAEAPGLAALSSALATRSGRVEVATTLADAARWLAAAPADAPAAGIVFVVDDAAPAPAWGVVDAARALQSVGRAGRAAPRRWWVTRGAHRVDGEVPSHRAAEQGAVWGAARVVATEHPDWWGGLVDLDSAAGLATQATDLARHLSAGSTEDEVALRGGARRALRLTRADAALGAARGGFAWRDDAAYLFTGGFGGIAQHVAREMVRQGARRLVLLGRAPLPPRSEWAALPDGETARRVAYVRSLEHAGASVHLLHADVADAAQLRAALEAYHAEGWPAIRGAIHTAAALDTRLTGEMDAAAFERVMAPKLAGALALDQALPELDLFVVFSSMMAFWAPAGEANYAAANAGLDALAVARRARGQHALSVQWGPWTNLGLWHGEAAERNMAALAAEGVRSFAPDVGVSFLAPLLAATEPVVAVVPIDWSAFGRARRGRDRPFFGKLADASGDAGAEPGGLVARLRNAVPRARRGMLEAAVRDALAGVLRRPADRIDAAHPFGAMGLDSLMALELRNRLQTSLERPLSATLAWNYPTVEQLGAHLATLFAEGDSRGAADAAAPVDSPEPQTRDAGVSAPSDVFDVARLLGELTALSDDDAARALRGGR
jgi:acyl transferase domain-containing protein